MSLLQEIATVCKPTSMEDTRNECLEDLKEIAHFFGGWDELRKEIDKLEDNDNDLGWNQSYH